MLVRSVKGFFARWKYLLFSCCVTYLLVFYIVNPEPKQATGSRITPNVLLERSSIGKSPDGGSSVPFNPVGGEPFFVEEVLTTHEIKLHERLTCNAKPGETKVILSWNAGHSQVNLGGCPDWNCILTSDRTQLGKADAVLISAYDENLKRTSMDQYFIHFSQESPKNSFVNIPQKTYFNMSLGFRHDSATSSPYGYTVRLGNQSHVEGELVDQALISKKTKGAAWFVSHCSTNSKREAFIKAFQKYYPVDIYGACGNLKCPRSGQCEKILDNDYDFYIAFENSICKDYNTEKLWKHGYTHTVIPIVMKRSIAEPFSPPHSFIAIDDFTTIQQMANYLHYLRENRTAYMEYFNWRRDHKVVFLDGSHHDVLERPWGFCQICRLVWESPKKHYEISDWTEFWTNSCEKDGELVDQILSASR